MERWNFGIIGKVDEKFLNWAFGTTSVTSIHSGVVRWNNRHGHLFRINHRDHWLTTLCAMLKEYRKSIKKSKKKEIT